MFEAPMKILNIRLGHAMNSSSSHSMIFLNDVSDNYTGGQDFGWNDFTLSATSSKRAYFAQQLFSNLREFVSDDIAELVVREWAGVSVDTDGHVDHQSIWALPRDWNGKGLNKEFIDDLRDFMLRLDLVVLGGNDNSDGHPLSDKSAFCFPFLETSNEPLRARKDPLGFWTIFNKATGAKIRFAFDESFKTAIDKSSAPELVDIKITDYCPYNCSMCYQASTTAGGHADLDRLQRISRALGELNVFEVAVGGGEPTMHPYFSDFMHSLRNAGIVPSFTTRNLSWLRDPSLVKNYLDDCGGFAYSVEKSSDITKLASLIEVAGIKDTPVTVQYVIGTGDLHSVIDTSLKHQIPLTLLGYKTAGRGKDDFERKMIQQRVQHETESWIKIAKESLKKSYGQIRIDTALAAQCEDLLKKQVDSRFWHVHEGAHSMYIDAVTGTYAACSFEDRPKAELLAKLGNKRFHMSDRPDAQEILKAFESIVPIHATDAAVA